jgi:DNA-directed RNA polymerase subunit RPC12/RpoP
MLPKYFKEGRCPKCNSTNIDIYLDSWEHCDGETVFVSDVYCMDCGKETSGYEYIDYMENLEGL